MDTSDIPATPSTESTDSMPAAAATLRLFTANPTLKAYYSNISSAYSDSSGIDLLTPNNITILPSRDRGKGVLVPLGIWCEMQSRQSSSIPYILSIRSSTGLKTPIRLSNSIGIIDRGYRGELCAIVDNISNNAFTIEKDTRMFQVLLPSLDSIQVNVVDSIRDLSDSVRGSNGFGSSGAGLSATGGLRFSV